MSVVCFITAVNFYLYGSYRFTSHHLHTCRVLYKIHCSAGGRLSDTLTKATGFFRPDSQYNKHSFLQRDNVQWILIKIINLISF